MKAVKTYDVIIIGAGPAGIFTALELADKGFHILMIEKGQDIRERIATSRNPHALVKDKVRNVVCGWGGAGAFSDGKLTLTTEFGGNLDDYMSKADLADKIQYVDSVYCKFGGADRKVYGDESRDSIHQLQRKAAAADLRFIPARIRHLGTDVNAQILTNMRDFLEGKVDIMADTMAEHIVIEDNTVQGVMIHGQLYRCHYLVSAPGREGSEWFVQEVEKLGLQLTSNAVDIGVRVEMPAEILETITDVVYESKLIYFSKSFDDRIRTFCMNPYGFVVEENNDSLLTVNGHSYAHKRSENTNFAILVSKKFTQPFHEPIKYGKYIANLANILGGGIIVQRLGDFLDGRRSTPERIKRGLVRPTFPEATPGDLSLVLPYRHMMDIKEMLEALDKIAPGANSRHTLIYGVEVKFYSNRLELSPHLETKIPNFFAIGDGAGITRGLVQSSATGAIVGQEILSRES